MCSFVVVDFFFESTKNYGLPRTFARLMRFHVERWYTVFCFQCAFHWSSWFKFWRAIKLNNVFQTTDWISQLRNKKQSAQRFLVSFLCYVIVMSLPSKTYIIMYSRSPSHAKQSQYLKEGKWIVAIKPYKKKTKNNNNADNNNKNQSDFCAICSQYMRSFVNKMHLVWTCFRTMTKYKDR